MCIATIPDKPSWSTPFMECTEIARPECATKKIPVEIPDDTTPVRVRSLKFPVYTAFSLEEETALPLSELNRDHHHNSQNALSLLIESSYCSFSKKDFSGHFLLFQLYQKNVLAIEFEKNNAPSTRRTKNYSTT